MEGSTGISLRCAYSQQELAEETCLFLGFRSELAGSPLPVITAGHISLLWCIDSPFFLGGLITEQDVWTFLAILELGYESLSYVMAHVQGDAAALAELVANSRLVKKAVEFEWLEVSLMLRGHLEIAGAGFEMIVPDGKSEEVSPGYDAAWLAHYAAGVMSAYPSISLKDAIWSLPFLSGGHLVAAQARANGAKVSRPIDIEAAMRELEEKQNGTSKK